MQFFITFWRVRVGVIVRPSGQRSCERIYILLLSTWFIYLIGTD